MNIAGEWTLFYSFGCGGGYSQTTVIFNANGTFKTEDGYTGQWVATAGDVQLVYEPAPGAVYSGNVIGGAMNGMMANFKITAQGCWYATTAKMPASFVMEKKAPGAERVDSSGGAKH